MQRMILKELLQDWEDPDVTQYYLACCLGLIEYDKSFAVFRDSKHLFWTSNPTSELLSKMIQEMVDNHLLEFDKAENKFRWNNLSSLSRSHVAAHEIVT